MPAPPVQEVVKGFNPDDEVDTFYKDGWWRGVVNQAQSRQGQMRRVPSGARVYEMVKVVAMGDSGRERDRRLVLCFLVKCVYLPN